ncbi:MAG TPA: PIG-L family deacetylase [Candidatus Limnocylindria bacterium]|nr:PIG-L family deacetylase [Candidatus Limnocylindria bacterium]
MPDGRGGLLLVHAHPDDEAMGTGGVIARCIAEGIRVDLVTCTGGEEGEIHDPALDPAEAAPRLAAIRAEELACALDALGDGAVNFHPLGYRDSGMMGTEANARADAFWNADLDVATGRLVSIVRSVRPAVIISYDSNGNYGHPDHINAYRIARGAFEAAGDPARYPDAGVPHTVAKRYEVAFSREHWFEIMREMQSRGIKLPWDFDDSLAAGSDAAAAAPGADELNPTNVEALRQVGEDLAEGEAPPEDFGTPEALITTRVDVSAYLDRKRACMDCHKTQRQDMGWVLDLPPDLGDRVLTPERFVLAQWQHHEIPEGLREESLFDGL